MGNHRRDLLLTQHVGPGGHGARHEPLAHHLRQPWLRRLGVGELSAGEVRRPRDHRGRRRTVALP